MRKSLIIVFLVSIHLSASADVPQTINYQGHLASSGGSPVNAAVDMTFTVYNAATSGSNLWAEVQTVQVNNGIYAVALGAVNPIDPAIIDGDLWLSDPETRTPEVVIRNGKAEFEPMTETIKNMGPNDVILKGANIIGLDMVPGVLCAHPQGGTIGAVYSTAVSQGIKIIVPISIEKFVPIEVADISNDLGGQKGIDYAQGLPVGVHPITFCDIFTEIDAFKMIANVNVFSIGAGGLYQGAGARVFEIEGDQDAIDSVREFLKDITSVKPLKTKLKAK